MHRISVFLECDYKLLRVSEKVFGYVKVMPDGSKRKWISKPQEVTWHRANLLALYMAVRNLDDNYELHIYGSDAYVLQKFEDGTLERWDKNGYQGKNGPVKDMDLWKELRRKTKYQKTVIHSGNHEYQQTMLAMFEEAKREADRRPADDI